MAEQQRSKPLWRSLVDRADGFVTPPANSFVRTDLFAEAVATATRLEVRLRRRMEKQTAMVWHAWNLPTAGDMRRVFSQLSALEARVRDLSARLDEEEREREAWRTKPAGSTRSAKTSSGRSSARKTGSSTSRASGARKSG